MGRTCDGMSAPCLSAQPASMVLPPPLSPQPRGLAQQGSAPPGRGLSGSAVRLRATSMRLSRPRQSWLRQKIRVDDYLTRAQIAERKERAPLMAHLRTKFPQLIPHWRGSRFIIKEGQGARLYKDTDASQAHDSQSAQAPQPPPAASARPRRPPPPAASRPAQTPAAASSQSSRPAASATAPQASAQSPSPAAPPATAPVEGDAATPIRTKGRTKKVVTRRSGVAQAAANASHAGQLAAAPVQQRARQSSSPSAPSASKPAAAAAAQIQPCQQPPGHPSPAATIATPRPQQQLP